MFIKCDWALPCKTPEGRWKDKGDMSSEMAITTMQIKDVLSWTLGKRRQKRMTGKDNTCGGHRNNEAGTSSHQHLQSHLKSSFHLPSKRCKVSTEDKAPGADSHHRADFLLHFSRVNICLRVSLFSLGQKLSYPGKLIIIGGRQTERCSEQVRRPLGNRI